MTNENTALADMTTTQIQEELKRRLAAQYPKDRERLIELAKEIAAYHGLKAKKVLEDCAADLTQKRV